MVAGITIPADAFKTAGQGGPRQPCVLGKRTGFPSRHRRMPPPSLGAACTRTCCGPLPVLSKGDGKYFVTVPRTTTPELSVVLPLTSKSRLAASVRDIITLLQTQSGLKVKRVRSTTAPSTSTKAWTPSSKARASSDETTIRYTPEQNGAAERLNRTLLDKVRSMPADSGLPKSLWAEALTTASYVRNRSPVSGRDLTPWELFFGRAARRLPPAHLRRTRVRPRPEAACGRSWTA
jgi:hypothetical protein